MTTTTPDAVTVPNPDALPVQVHPNGVIEAVHADVFDDPPGTVDDVVNETLAAFERHLSWVTLPDVLELGVLVESDEADPETAFVDTLEQAFDHLANWQ